MQRSSQKLIYIKEEDYIRLKEKIESLQNENSKLKSDLEKIASHKKISIKNVRQQGQIYRQYNIGPEYQIPSIANIKQEWVKWSHLISAKVDKFNNKIGGLELTEDSQNKIKEGKNTKLGIIENICLFGVNDDDICEMQNLQSKYIQLDAKLLYPEDKRFQPYGGYFFPDKIQVKSVKGEKQQTQTNRIIFKKNTKKTQVSIYIFQPDEAHQILTSKYKNNAFIKATNPARRLYAFAVYFSDFFTKSCSSQSARQQHIIDQEVSGQIKNNNSQRNMEIDTKKVEKCQFYVSKYCICLMTYFPLINLLEKILIKIIDQIKIKRISIYQQNALKADINYLICELKVVVERIMHQINQIPVEIGSVGTVSLSHQVCIIDLSMDSINRMIYQNWVYHCLKIFKKDSFFEVLCFFIMEESICFLSEDLHTLTYLVFLFSDLLLRPFSCPHPCVSVVFREELLGTPFTVTMGINKSTKWLQQNQHLISQNKIIINFNEELTIIRNKHKPIKNDKLKKIISEYYKKIQVSSIDNIFKKKQTKHSPEQQDNQNCLNLINNLRNYFQEDIIDFLPTNDYVCKLKYTLKVQNQTQLLKETIKLIENHFFIYRKKDKDQFIQQFSEQQIFYMYICQHYGLK